MAEGLEGNEVFEERGREMERDTIWLTMAKTTDFRIRKMKESELLKPNAALSAFVQILNLRGIKDHLFISLINK